MSLRGSPLSVEDLRTQALPKRSVLLGNAYRLKVGDQSIHNSLVCSLPPITGGVFEQAQTAPDLDEQNHDMLLERSATGSCNKQLISVCSNSTKSI